jgi:hypothetical protein
MAPDADLHKLYCEGGENTAANWTRTGSYGPSIAAMSQCNTVAGVSEALMTT